MIFKNDPLINNKSYITIYDIYKYYHIIKECVNKIINEYNTYYRIKCVNNMINNTFNNTLFKRGNYISREIIESF